MSRIKKALSGVTKSLNGNAVWVNISGFIVLMIMIMGFFFTIMGKVDARVDEKLKYSERLTHLDEKTNALVSSDVYLASENEKAKAERESDRKIILEIRDIVMKICGKIDMK